MSDQRYSDNDVSKRDIPSFIEPRPPLIQNPFMRPRPQKGINLLEQFEEDSELEEPELVQVYLRLKPCSVPNSMYEIRGDKCLVTSLDTATVGHGRRTQHNVPKMYTFSKIFRPECNQKEIFEAVVKDNLKRLPDGHNFTLLSYGASGSGKTYTLMGTVGAPGLVPRSLEYVFRLVDAAQQPAYKPAENGAEKLHYVEQEYELQWVKRLRHVSAPLRDKYRRMSTQLHNDLTSSSIDLSKRVRHYVWVSFVEIYNEAVYDLLVTPDKRMKLRIREDSSGNVYVKGATQAFVRSGEEAYDVLAAGKHNLVVAATGVHAHSSRSHCIFTITMLTEAGDGSVRTSYVRLCDLAGCERARATRNTGARMAESRAINSSLHVLERCLHMLRRKQKTKNDTMVPYRESKLTRLLGTGLSGARGEAVAMVVTLNPAPQYAHETKHVLGLAVVAQDIQVNNTIMTSDLESSASMDATLACSTEVMRLRSDNERLHFELVQSQARIRELMAAMEERQQETANTMRELVEEAKDMTKQYYEGQLETLRAQMDEMIDEYESRLSKEAAPLPPLAGAGTPSRYLQAKVSKLSAEIAILEEKLLAESLARTRVEKEVQYLRTCIDERDEKVFKDDTPPQDEIDLSSSEDENDDNTDDPFNESLEPIFKKEKKLNRSIAIQNEKNHDTTHSMSVHTIDNIEEEDDETSDIEKSNNNTIIEDSKTNEETDLSNKVDATNNSIDSNAEDSLYNTKDLTRDVTYDEEITNESNTSNVTHTEDRDLSLDNDIQIQNESFKSAIGLRGTYFVRDDKVNAKGDEQTLTVKKMNPRGTYCVNEPVEHKDKTIEKLVPEFVAPKEKSATDMAIPKTAPEPLVNKIIKSFKTRQSSNCSLRQFEQLEKDAIDCEDEIPPNQYLFGGIKLLKEKKKYFNNESRVTEQPKDKHNDAPIAESKKKRTYFDNTHVNTDVNNKIINEIKNNNDDRSPSIVKDIVSDNFEPSTIKKLLGESFTKPDVISSIHKAKLINKKHDSVDMFEGYDSPLLSKAKEVILSPIASKSKEITSQIVSNTKKTAAETIEISTKPNNVMNNIEFARQSIEQLVLNQSAKKAKQLDLVTPVNDNNETVNKPDKLQKDIKLEAMSSVDSIDEKINIKTEAKLEPTSSIDEHKDAKLEQASSVDEPNQTIPANITNVDNTIDEFENIYKDITAPRATEFEILAQEINETNINDNTENQENNSSKCNEMIEKSLNKNKENNLTDKNDKKLNKSETDHEKVEIKYNLRKKQSNAAIKSEKSNDEEVVLESSSKPKRRPLRLRRRKNEDEDESNDKLKDIVNLQSEFSDVTLDVPATKKEVKDIPSPEKGLEENRPPPFGIQSCPSKSVTRSRRKLFTPRPEPLEESLSQTGDSNERLYVPRPSYHRPRARRKL